MQPPTQQSSQQRVEDALGAGGQQQVREAGGNSQAAAADQCKAERVGGGVQQPGRPDRAADQAQLVVKERLAGQDQESQRDQRLHAQGSLAAQHVRAEEIQIIGNVPAGPDPTGDENLQSGARRGMLQTRGKVTAPGEFFKDILEHAAGEVGRQQGQESAQTTRIKAAQGV